MSKESEATNSPAVQAAKPVLEVLRATDNHLQALMHYGHSADLRVAIDTVGQLQDALGHLVRYHDQLTPADIVRAKTILDKATGGGAA